MDKVGTTTILCSNIHCPSCVKTIEETLHRLGDAVLKVSTSTVTQTIVIEHKDTITAHLLAQALYDAGFDVQSLWEQRGHSRTSLLSLAWLSPDADTYRPEKLSKAFQEFSCGLIQSPEQADAHRAMHNANCSQCGAVSTTHERQDSEAGLIAQSIFDQRMIEDLDVVSAPMQERMTYDVVITVGGMTCSVCVGRVQEVLEANPHVISANVNLLSQSASLVVDNADKAADLVEEIEDIGYEAGLESCEPRQIGDSSKCDSKLSLTREVMIKVRDMYCEHCPSKVTAALLAVDHEITIVQQPVHTTGLLTIRYTPQAPEFTIRTILQAIRAADPRFKPIVFTLPSLEERALKLQHEHQKYLLSRLIMSVMAAIPTFAWGVVIMDLLPSDNPTRRYWMDTWIGDRIQAIQLPLLVLATFVYFACTIVFHRRALKELYMMWRPASRIPLLRRFYRFGSMDMLLSLGTTVAYVGSIFIIVIDAVSRSHDDPNEDENMATTTYFDAVVFLTMFLLAGRLLEAYGKAKTADAVSSLTKLKPKEALLLQTQSAKSEGSIEQSVETIPLDELECGDVVVVPPGMAPPSDGEILFGSTSFDESSLTGESRAVAKSIGDTAYTGTVNLTNAVHLRTTGSAGMSMLDSIIDTVREGQAKRAPIERFADILTGYFVPLIVLLALLDWLIWTLLGYDGQISYVQVGTGGWVFWALQFAIAVLVVACPCGIGLAAPTALFVGTGLAAKHGILVKGGGEAFQEASELDCVVFDKTGTITQGGRPRITDDLWFLDDEDDIIRSAMLQVESHSSHPIAKAVAEFCNLHQQTIPLETVDVQEISGKGMTGSLMHRGSLIEIFVGNEKLLQEHDVFCISTMLEFFQTKSREAKTVIFVGYRKDNQPQWQCAAMLAAWDPVRPEAEAVIRALKSRHVDVWLLSGDNATTAQAVARTIGLSADHVIAEVLPHQKAEKVQMLQRACTRARSRLSVGDADRRRAVVAMVGDGINDAPALAMADVGIAMGSGSDTAISSADFVLLISDLTAVLMLIRLSKVVLRRVKFNFAWAIGYNLLMLPFAAGVFYPVVSNGSHVRLDPVWASLAMALSSISVVLSSLLLRTKLPLLGFREAYLT